MSAAILALIAALGPAELGAPVLVISTDTGSGMYDLQAALAWPDDGALQCEHVAASIAAGDVVAWCAPALTQDD